METNETILTREIVSIDDRKRLGALRELCVDCDTLSVSHYIVNSASTNASLVLPFDKSIAVGDTFMTIQSRDDFISTADGEAKRIMDEGYRLLGVEVFSQNGNRVGTVESYEFDPTHGKITKIILGKRLSYTSDSFVFFAPDFVFVDDGESTAYEVRHGARGTRGRKKGSTTSVSKTTTRAARKTAEMDVDEPLEIMDDLVDTGADAGTAARNSAPVDTKVVAADVDEDAVLKEFLVDARVTDAVESKDGLFRVEKGTKLTKELVDEAQKHDALLLLTMSVES
ncbi:MAG: PRC-barrel domain-containing protein [Eggerthellaceae bacterium]|jgi:sporulation protein YlmC with PRC-barrel domain|nr:PRC-barrel domain-containing protein [Eggerthellaceae bacterium]MDR2716298.1 PRC-barrel domain-containing protein [Coriobacteriaceae bacterium]